MNNEKIKTGNYWVCIIGPVETSELPQGADAPPRSAAQDAVIEMIGRQPECWSGWGTDQAHFDQIMKVWNSKTLNSNDERIAVLTEALGAYADAEMWDCTFWGISENPHHKRYHHDVWSGTDTHPDGPDLAIEALAKSKQIGGE